MQEECPVISNEDLRAALREIGTYVDITEEDLGRIYAIALEHARQRLSARALVREVMTTEVVSVKAGDDIHEAARLLSEHKISGLPVVDADNCVIGVISEADILATTGLQRGHTFRDIVRHLLGEPLPMRKEGDLVEDVMATPAITTTAEAGLAEVARVLDSHRIKRLPVVDAENRLIGIVSRGDIVRGMVQQ